jgi:hypothetical protein
MKAKKDTRIHKHSSIEIDLRYMSVDEAIEELQNIRDRIISSYDDVYNMTIEEETEYGYYNEQRTFLQIEFSYMFTPKEKKNKDVKKP